jgi:hypothetical protein
VSSEQRAHLIERYAGSYDAIVSALQGLGDKSMDDAPPGEWLARRRSAS